MVSEINNAGGEDRNTLQHDEKVEVLLPIVNGIKIHNRTLERQEAFERGQSTDNEEVLEDNKSQLTSTFINKTADQHEGKSVETKSNANGNMASKSDNKRRRSSFSNRLIRMVSRKDKPKKEKKCHVIPPYSTYVSIDHPIVSELIEMFGDTATSQQMHVTHYFKDVLAGDNDIAIDYILEPLGSRNFYMVHLVEKSKKLPLEIAKSTPGHL